MKKHEETPGPLKSSAEIEAWTVALMESRAERSEKWLLRQILLVQLETARQVAALREDGLETWNSEPSE